MRKKLLLFLGLSVVGIGVGYLFDNLFNIGNCYVNGVYKSGILCEDFFSNVAGPLIPAATALSLVFLTLSFVPKAFTAWKQFAVWAIPISTFIFIIAPESNSGGLGGVVAFGPTADDIYLSVSVAFLVISVGIIAYVRMFPHPSRFSIPKPLIPILVFIALFAASAWKDLWVLTLALFGVFD